MTTRFGSDPDIVYNPEDTEVSEYILDIALQIKQTLEAGGRVLLLTPASDEPQELTLKQEV